MLYIIETLIGFKLVYSFLYKRVDLSVIYVIYFLFVIVIYSFLVIYYHYHISRLSFKITLKNQ
jgi:hypothetical protein